MGYTTDFVGSVLIDPPLNQQEIDFLTKFAKTRRISCKQGPYYVDRGGFAGQDRGDDVLDYNRPPSGQPSLWCQWVPTDKGDAIEWDGGEKFYESDEWMAYLIDHFIGRNPRAKSALPFLQGHTCNGEIEAQGEERDDRWALVVRDNKVFVKRALNVQYGQEEEV